ncbi:hypothetical protein JW933_07975 [candidate division FCPU426 bacterium]|nr:hypothetical protein [candidate division FCPU426 bacterium]
MPKQNKTLFLAAVMVFFLAACLPLCADEPAPAFLQPKSPSVVFKEKTVGKITSAPVNGTLALKANYTMVAYLSIGNEAVLLKPDRLSIGGNRGIHAVAKGKKGRNYSFIKTNTAFLSTKGGQFVYTAMRKMQWTVVVGTKEHGFYDDIRDLAISPDGMHIAYAGHAQDKWWIIKDHKKQAGYEDILNLSFSADNKNLVYAAKIDGQWVAVHNNLQGKTYDSISHFTYNLKADRLAYGAGKGGQYFLVVDNKEIPLSAYVINIIFSPNGKRWFCLHNEGIMVDGQPLRQDHTSLGYDSDFFSPDSRHYAFCFTSFNPDSGIFMDGFARPVNMGTPRFSPDSTMITCERLDGKTGYYCLAVDEWQTNKAFSSLPSYPLAASQGKYYACQIKKPDGKVYISTNYPKWQTDEGYREILHSQTDSSGEYFAYAAETGRGTAVYINGRRCTAADYLDIRNLTFSPDSRHLAFFGKTQRLKWHLVVDNHVSPKGYDSPMSPGSVIFDEPNRLRAMVIKRDKFVRLEARCR